jgi:hypothetical protein
MWIPLSLNVAARLDKFAASCTLPRWPGSDDIFARLIDVGFSLSQPNSGGEFRAD